MSANGFQSVVLLCELPLAQFKDFEMPLKFFA